MPRVPALPSPGPTRFLIPELRVNHVMAPSLSVIIPAYNEEERLPTVMAEVRDYLARQHDSWELIVVDDGSSDRTAALARQAAHGDPRIRLLQHPDGANHGKGAAVRRGMLAATGKVRLFMDADNSTTIDQARGLLDAVERGCEMVVGSRRTPGAEIRVPQGPHRVLAGIVGNFVIRAITAQGITDTQAGFKAFTADCAEVVFSRLTVARWAFDVEALVVARHHGFRICEAPITWAHSEESKIRLPDYLRFLADVVRVRINLARGIYDRPPRR